MAYVNQSVEEILVLARHGALKKTSRNCALIEALGQDILGSLDDDDLGRDLSHVCPRPETREKRNPRNRSRCCTSESR